DRRHPRVLARDGQARPRGRPRGPERRGHGAGTGVSDFMKCPDVDRIAADELDEPVRAHLSECAPCRERRDKLARLLAFPAMAPPPPDVLPRLLARIDEKIAREVARP